MSTTFSAGCGSQGWASTHSQPAVASGNFCVSPHSQRASHSPGPRGTTSITVPRLPICPMRETAFRPNLGSPDRPSGLCKAGRMTAHAAEELGPAVTTEVADGVFAYVQPDGSWWINNTGFLVGADEV